MNSLLQDFRGSDGQTEGARADATPPVGPTISTLEMMSAEEGEALGGGGAGGASGGPGEGQAVPGAAPHNSQLEERLLAFYQLRSMQQAQQVREQQASAAAHGPSAPPSADSASGVSRSSTGHSANEVGPTGDPDDSGSGNDHVVVDDPGVDAGLAREDVDDLGEVDF